MFILAPWIIDRIRSKRSRHCLQKLKAYIYIHYNFLSVYNFRVLYSNLCCSVGPLICLEDGERALEEAFVVDGSSAAPQSYAVIKSRQHHADKVLLSAGGISINYPLFTSLIKTLFQG